MPLYKCDSCHHEWEGILSREDCDWCGQQGHVIEKVTRFEQFLKILGEKDYKKCFKKIFGK